MVQVHLSQIFILDPAVNEGIDLHSQCGSEYKPYDEVHEFDPPDIGDSFTRKVNEGWDHGLLPAPFYPSNVLETIWLDFFVDFQILNQRRCPCRWLHEREYRLLNCFIVILEFSGATISVIPEQFFWNAQDNFQSMIGQLQIAQAKMNRAVLSFDRLCFYAEILAFSICNHLKLSN
jgi:hypothetical protein